MGSQNSSKSDLVSYDNEPRELKKAVEAIHISAPIGLLQKKIMNNLVFYSYNELSEKETHQVSLSTLAKDIGFDSNNIAFLKKQLKQLIDITIEWNVLKNGAESWRASSLLAEAAIESGVVSYSFPPMLRRMLHNPKIFSIINLRLMKKFKSTYAYSLYENCFRFRDVGSTGFHPVETWKKLLGVDPSLETYSTFKLFNQKILSQATKEVNEVTDIQITPEFQYMGRKVIAIRFLIKAKVNSDFNFPTDDQTKVDLLGKMLKLGIPEQDAIEHFEKYPLDVLHRAVDMMEERVAKSKVKVPGAYFRKLLELPPEEISMQQTKETSSEPTVFQQIIENEKKQNEEARSQLQEAEIFYNELSNRERLNLEERFVTYIEQHNKIIYNLYKESGLTGTRMVKAEFNSWLTKTRAEVKQ